MTYNWKPLFLLSFIFTLTTGQTLLAQPADGPPRGGGGDRDELRKQLLERFDKNNDGELDDDEREAARESFRRGDRPEGASRAQGRPSQQSNRGGRSSRGGRGGRGGKGQRITLIPKFDKDGDGILNKAERTEARKYVIEQRDGGDRGGRPQRPDGDRGGRPQRPVSYTHLTLPTKRIE